MVLFLSKNSFLKCPTSKLCSFVFCFNNHDSDSEELEESEALESEELEEVNLPDFFDPSLAKASLMAMSTVLMLNPLRILRCVCLARLLETYISALRMSGVLKLLFRRISINSYLEIMVFFR